MLPTQRELLTTVPPLAVQVTVNTPCLDDSTLIVTSTDETVNVWNIIIASQLGIILLNKINFKGNVLNKSIMHNSVVKIMIVHMAHWASRCPQRQEY